MPWKKLPNPSKKEEETFFVRFRKKARFLVDEDVDSEVVYFLREQGWNVVSALEVGLNGQPDENVFSFAWKERRMILSHDRGFLDNKKYPVHRNPGIVIIEGGSGDSDKLFR